MEKAACCYFFVLTMLVDFDIFNVVLGWPITWQKIYVKTNVIDMGWTARTTLKNISVKFSASGTNYIINGMSISHENTSSTS